MNSIRLLDLSRSRQACAVALAAVVLSWLGPWIHLAVVNHVECSTHGVVEHGGDHHGVAHAAALPHEGAEDGHDEVSLTGGDVGEGDDHDACQLNWTRPTRLTSWTVDLAPADLLVHVAPSTPADTHGFDGVSLLRRAPKTSPPGV